MNRSQSSLRILILLIITKITDIAATRTTHYKNFPGTDPESAEQVQNMAKNVFKQPKFNLFHFFKNEKVRFSQLKYNYELIPLVAANVCIFSALPLVIWSRTIENTVDVTFGGLPRWEIPSKPTWYDLRNPRPLKWVNSYHWKPCIHLDNRYRAMRGEPMLDANGNETDEIGEDETAVTIDLSKGTTKHRFDDTPRRKIFVETYRQPE